MGKGLFETVFGVTRAYNQVLTLVLGLVLLAVGVLLFAWFLYDHLTGRRVRGRIAGVRLCKGGNKAGAPVEGETYSTIYEYRAEDGTTVRGGDGSSSNWMGNRVPGTQVALYADRSRPDRVMRAGLVRPLGGVALAVPGILIIRSALDSGFGFFSYVVAGCVLAYAVVLIHRATKPKERRETKEQFQARIAKAWQDGREMSEPELRERLAASQKAGRSTLAVVGAIATGLVCLGVWLGHETAGLVLRGERAAGRVVRMESEYSSGRRGGYTYYPVVAFDGADGERSEFRDRVGSSMPALASGDAVTVVYDPRRPRGAMIDRGVWNWAAPGGCWLAGVLLMVTVARNARNRRRAARYLAGEMAGE